MKVNNGSSAFVTYTIVALLSAAFSFVTMIILTRMASEAFFGKINKFLTASNVLMSIICLGLDSAYIRFYYEPPEGSNRKQLAWKCMVPALGILLLVTFFIIPLQSNPFITLLLGEGGSLFTTAFIITVFSLFLNRFMTIYFRMEGKVACFSIATIAFALLTKTIYIPIYHITPEFKDNIVLATILLAIFMITFFLLIMKNMIEVPHKLNAQYRPVYRYALFSSPVIVFAYLNSYLPQVIISSNLGDDVLGVYSAALLFCLAIQVLSSGFTTFWSPYMYKNYKTEQETIIRMHDVILLMSVLVLSIILIFNDFLYLFIGEAFRKNQNILGMLLIYPITLIIVETVAYGIGIKKKNEITLAIYLISTTINVVLCFFWAPKYGLSGIAFASMISAIVQTVLMTYFGQKYYKSIRNIYRTLVHVFILTSSAVLFNFLYDDRVLFVMLEIAMIITCLVYDKHVIGWGVNLLRAKSTENSKLF